MTESLPCQKVLTTELKLTYTLTHFCVPVSWASAHGEVSGHRRWLSPSIMWIPGTGLSKCRYLMSYISPALPLSFHSGLSLKDLEGHWEI